MKKKKIVRRIILAIFIIGFLIPQKFSMPVNGATKADYHPDSFWYYPWGKSVTHKGIDIFAEEGTKLRSSIHGLVIYNGNIKTGGNVVLILGPKWRFHYFAHLDKIKTSTLSWATREELIGTVGSSGNASGKPAHLHYSIITPIPYIWRIDKERQAWKKMFFLNPIDYLED